MADQIVQLAQGPFRLAEDPNENLFGEGVSLDILDTNDFPVAEIPTSPIVHKWSEKFPKMRHWSEGADDGRTQVQRTKEELLALAALFKAAPQLLAACQRAADYLGSPSQEYRKKYPDRREGGEDKHVAELLKAAVENALPPAVVTAD